MALRPAARTTSLLVAFLVPTALLGWTGWQALQGTEQRARARHAAQAQALAEALQERVRAQVARLADDPPSADVVVLTFDAEGARTGRPDAADTPRGTAATPLERALRDEVDDLQRREAWDEGTARLRAVADATGDESLAAWALETLAAFERRRGNEDARAEALRELVERYPAARDARGLVRALVARAELPDVDLAALHADALRDWTRLDQTATAHFLALLEERAPPAQRATLAGERRAHALPLRVDAAVPLGLSDWIARGTPGGVTEVTLPAAPFLEDDAPRPGDGRALALAERDGDGWTCRVIPTERLLATAARAAAADPTTTALGFAPALEDDLGRLLPILDDPGDGAAAAARPLPPPLAAYRVVVRGGDLDATLAAERRRRLLTGALVGAALLASFVAAFATLRAVAREAQAARGREAFVAAVTHELKAPLASIRLFAEMLERGGVDADKVREFGARTVEESDRLVRLVDGVLELARSQHALDAPTAPRVDLGELAQSVAARFGTVASQRGFDLELRLRDAGVVVRGDRDALGGALLNLLDNALKYSDQPHTIELVVQRIDGERAEVAVLDRGRGVAARDAERVFEPFTRLGDELTRDRPGVGLGLALVRRVADLHGGRARVTARDGGGSRFALELPTTRPEEQS